MMVLLEVRTWQLLRILARAGAAGRDVAGADLRVILSQKTRDGTFLDALVGLGLITVSAPAPPLPADAPYEEKNRAVQLRTRYRLTDLGRHAAEYGEYDRPFAPAGGKPPAPVQPEAPARAKKPGKGKKGK